jgi:uncharacterized repeat protein (TIGR02543 family)
MKSSLRRSLFLFCVFTLIMAVTTGSVAAAQEREGELIQEVVFDKADLMFGEYEDYDVVNLAGHGTTGQIGKPSLPQASVSVVLPPGARVTRVEIISSESEILPGTYKIMPAQRPKPIGSEKSSVIVNNIDYHAVAPYPGKLVQHAYTGSRGGYQVAGIFVYPLQYVPSEKSLRFYSSVKFKVIYQESTRSVKAKTATQIEVFADMVEEMVINPEDVGGWAPPVQSTSENNHDYFIITSSGFVDEFQPLVDWKNRKGVRTEMATIEDIDSSYSGSDLQEKIKNFIIDMESTHGAVYFLLGGDTNVVPHKLLTTEYIFGPLDGEPIPSDLYYSDLNGDLYSDVFVGRAPAANEDEVTTFVNKVLTYEKNPPLVDYPLEALMMAFWLDSTSNAEDIKEECETHIPTPFNVDEFYQSQGETGRIPAINRINQGFGVLNHADHTNYNAWGVGYYGGSGFMTLSDISSLTNGDELSVIYSIGCYSAALEYDCCAERFLNNPAGGAVSYIGNSRYGWYVIGDATHLGGDLDEEFYISLFSRGLYNLGEAHADAKDQWVDEASGLFGNPYYKYTILELNLLGDPEMPVWTDNISETDATHLSTIPLGASEFTVTVTENDGTPIEGALVCCMMDDFSVYEKGYTDTSGELTLAVSPTHDGMMWITASKHNYLPYEGLATVAGEDTYTLTVSTEGDGSVALGPAGGSYLSGTVVTLTANSDPGWSFSHWSGDLGGSANPETITMDSNKNVTATFTQDTYTLTVNTEGNGSVELSPAGGSYLSGTVVTLTANADPSWTFDGWSGDLTGSTNPETITMDSNKNVTATFIQDTYTLMVNTEGDGSVALDPAGGTYSSGTVVTLTANSDPGWSFSHWSGDLGGSANPETITMDSNKNVTATFTQDTYTLTVNTEGDGSVALDPAGGTYSSGTVVTLMANADPGWTFDSWSGDLEGTDNPKSITMDGDKTVTATFVQDTYSLMVNTEGNGSVELSPAGGSYPYGTVVTLMATADPGWTFTGWSGDLAGFANPETITMNGNKTVTATFAQDTYTQDVANQDIPVSGTVSGDYIDTQSSNGNYESITEILSPGKSGKSYLEHKWTVDVTGGATVTFYIEAYHSPNSEGDDFEFSHSTDDQTYTYMLTVVKTEENNGYQTFSLPSNLSGTVYIRVTDTDQTRGNTFKDSIYIDHMYIESSPSTDDTTPPSEVTELSASTGDYGQVILTWTAPGDDDNTGIASEYDIRYVLQANGPIDTEGEWLGASPVTGEPIPSAAGTPESMTVGGLVPGASYYFAIKTADEVPNWSALSNSPSGTAGSAVKVKDFADQDITISGRVSGDYAYTHSSDDNYQSITEAKSHGKLKESYLEHKWTINVTGGTTVTFYVEAYHSSNGEGDDFEFSYSTDDDTYIRMLTVEKTADNSTFQTYSLPSSLSGTVYVRVTDTDQTIDNSSLDTIYIDYMYIESELL